MPRRKIRIEHAEVVRRFAARLREVRRSRGMTQAELARQANVSVPYISKLETAGAAPGLDLIDRLAKALGTPITELVPTEAAPDTRAVLRAQAERLLETILQSAEQETLLLVTQFLARIAESPSRG